MGFFDNLKNQIGSQFIEIIEWLDQSNDTLVYRFPVYNQEIKMGAQLIVRENQVALFVNEGQAADLFRPGHYTLSTQNIPILTTLRGWKYGFQSPFKAEVYFFNTRLFTDLKWGTVNPVMMRDPEFGMIRLRGFGTYTMKIGDAKVFFQTIVGTQGLTTTEDILGQLRSTILSRLSDALGESKIAALDLASKYDELSTIAVEKLRPEFGGYGLDLARFFIENISLPEEVEAAIDQRTKLGVLGDRLGRRNRLAVGVARGHDVVGRESRRHRRRRRRPRRGAGHRQRHGQCHGTVVQSGQPGRRPSPAPQQHRPASPAGRRVDDAALVAGHRRQDLRPLHGRSAADHGAVRPGAAFHQRLAPRLAGLGPDQQLWRL